MKFLVVDKMHESLMPMLKSIGIEADYEPDIDKREIASRLKNYEGLVIRSKVTVDQKLIEGCDKLVVVCRAGAGIDNLDVAYLESRGIHIVNAPEGNRNAVAEHCLGLVFALLNNVVSSNLEINNRKWDREGNRGHEIKNKTLGIIGYGFMGSAVAEKFQHLGCKVIAYDKYRTGYATTAVEEVSLSRLFKETDILTVHVPLTEETRLMINREFLSHFDKDIWLINTSRGEVASLEDIDHLLDTGKVIGAALDVLENEKINALDHKQEKVFNKLTNQDNVILTPHVAGWTYESYVEINSVLVKKLKSFFEL